MKRHHPMHMYASTTAEDIGSSIPSGKIEIASGAPADCGGEIVEHTGRRTVTAVMNKIKSLNRSGKWAVVLFDETPAGRTFPSLKA